MKVRQVVEAGNVESTYVWSNSIEFNVEGGEVKLNLTNEQMIKLHKRLTERVESIREEQLGLARDAVEKADAEVANFGE